MIVKSTSPCFPTLLSPHDMLTLLQDPAQAIDGGLPTQRRRGHFLTGEGFRDKIRTNVRFIRV